MRAYVLRDLQDVQAALDFVSSGGLGQGVVDNSRVALWGVSYSGALHTEITLCSLFSNRLATCTPVLLHRVDGCVHSIEMNFEVCNNCIMGRVFQCARVFASLSVYESALEASVKSTNILNPCPFALLCAGGQALMVAADNTNRNKVIPEIYTNLHSQFKVQICALPTPGLS